MINPIGQSSSEEIYPTNDDLFHHEFSTNLAQRMEFHGTQWIQLRPEYKEEPINCLDGSFHATYSAFQKNSVFWPFMKQNGVYSN